MRTNYVNIKSQPHLKMRLQHRQLQQPQRKVSITDLTPEKQDIEVKKIGRKKKFITRVKQYNLQSSSNIAQSYSKGDYDGVSTQREKNNLAARNSRKRKKIYVRILEERINNLQLQLHNTNEEIETHRTEIFNALMHTDQINSKNAQIQNTVIKKLKNLCQSEGGSSVNTEINICLDSCIYRIGASGSERRAILDILYKGFINRNLPNNYRFILWYSINKLKIRAGDEWWLELIASDIMKQSFSRFIEDKGEEIQRKGMEILILSKKILLKKQEIQNSGYLFDRLIKELREILTPAQFTHLFLFADRATPKKQLELFIEREQRKEEQFIIDIDKWFPMEKKDNYASKI